ncbi:MAG: hypothetical protein AAFN10_06210 [Bacteroidota bacterium]
MKILRRVLSISLIALLLGIIAFNLSLLYSPKYQTFDNCRLNQDLIYQLRHLKGKLQQGAAKEMQGIYPEGYLFINALYGLSWAEIPMDLPAESALYQEAHQEINWALTELNSAEGKRVFNPNLSPAYGIFYQGWTNYLLGRKLALLPPAKRDSSEIRQFQNSCEAILAALANQKSPYLESYSRSCWPADMVVAMASVALSAKIGQTSYETEITDWLDKVKQQPDSLGLIPHSVEWKSGKVREAARGNSQSLILNFLIEIEEEFARSQFEIYKEQFLDYRLFLPGIREHSQGVDHNGDVDSGPVIWGIGGAASLVGQRTMGVYGENAVAIGLRNSIETFGLGTTIKGEKSYLMGKLPIADAFIAWSNSIEAYEKNRLSTPKKWRFKIQLASLIVILLGGFLVFRIW